MIRAMVRIRAGRCASAGIGIVVLLVLSAGIAHAQAWLPAQGEGTVSLVVQDVATRYHYLPSEPFDRGHIRSESMALDFTYGLTDQLAVSIGIPWVLSKYNGATPHPLVDTSGPVPVFYGANPLDDGTYHGAFQDFRFDVRYNLTKRGIVLTPFIGSVVPSHDYSYFAHAAPGRDLKELQVGVSAAKMLDALVPGLFVQGRYAYGITEQVLDISHNRSMAGLEIGYFVTPKMRLMSINTGQITHGGVDLTQNSRVDLGPVLWSHHDQVDRVNFLNMGGGASYSVTENVDLFGSAIHAVGQRNGHAVEYGLTIGASWSFSTRRGQTRAIASAEDSLVRCVCEKGTK